MTENDRENDRKRSRKWVILLEVEGWIPRKFPDFPRIFLDSVHIPQKNTPGAESTEGINFCCFYIFI